MLGAKRCIPTGLCTLAPSASGPKIICGCLSAGHAGERSKSASLPKTQLPAPQNGRAHSSDHPTSLAPSQSITALRVPRGKEDGGRRLRAPAPKGTPPPGPPQRVKAALRTVAERRSKQGRGSPAIPSPPASSSRAHRPHPVTGRARGSYPRCRWFGKAWPSTAKARLWWLSRLRYLRSTSARGAGSAWCVSAETGDAARRSDQTRSNSAPRQ